MTRNWNDEIFEAIQAQLDVKADEKAGYPPNCKEGYAEKDGKCVLVEENSDSKKNDDDEEKNGDDKKKKKNGDDKKKNGDDKKKNGFPFDKKKK